MGRRSNETLVRSFRGGLPFSDVDLRSTENQRDPMSANSTESGGPPAYKGNATQRDQQGQSASLNDCTLALRVTIGRSASLHDGSSMYTVATSSTVKETQTEAKSEVPVQSID